MNNNGVRYKQWLDLVLLLIKRDLKIRYRNSVLGYLWSMLNPLLMMSILTVAFSHYMRTSLQHYPLYILSGLLCWNMTSQSTTNGVGSIINNASLLKKVRVPSWVFPAATIGSATVHMCLALVPYFLLALVLGHSLTGWFLQLPLVLALLFIFILGVVLTLGTLNVFFRDVSHVIDPVLQLVFYATPIIYPLTSVPEKYRVFLQLNPLYYFEAGFRSALYEGVCIAPGEWGVMVLLSLVSLGLGWLVYSKSEDRFLYHL